MARFLVGLLCGAGLVAGLALVGGLNWLRGSSGCWGRCGDGTRCVDHHCLAAAAPAAPAPSKHAGRHHRRAGGDSAAAPPAIELHPGDEKMIAQGDSLGRAEHVDLTAAGDDGKELEQDDLDRAFHPAQPSIERCITDALGDIPLESGRVEVAFRIERSGQVSRARVTAPAILQRQGLTRCVRAVVDALRFPASGGASVVTYPFELR